MQTLVIYDSKFGNTEKIAQAIARGIGPVSEVRVTSTAEATSALEALASRPDLVLVGGPTQNPKALAKTGAEIVAPPESFFIVRHGPQPLQTLEPGELERAEAWGRTVASSAHARPAAASAGSGRP